jgi:hypothetical protein
MVPIEAVNSFLPTIREMRRSMVQIEATVTGIFLVAIAAILYRFWPANAAVMILGILAAVVFFSLELFFLARLWWMRRIFR